MIYSALRGKDLTAHTDPTNPGRALQALILIPAILLPLLFILALHAGYYMPFIADDALISLRYSQRLIQGYGLTWSDGKAVEGYSNLLWVLLTALGGRLGFDLIDAARLLGFFSVAAALAAVFTHYRPASPAQSLPAVTASLALVLAGPVAVWTIGGLEQPLILGLLAWALVLCYPLFEGKTVSLQALQWPGLLLGLLCLTRPDGALFTALIVLAILLVRGFNRQAILSALAIALLPAVLYLAQLGFRLLYYGEWLPNTAFVKIIPSRAHLVGGIMYVKEGLLALLPLPALAALSAILGLWQQKQRPKTILLLLLLGGWLGYIAVVGGDIFPAWRHFLPAILLMALLTAQGVEWLGARFTNRRLPAALAGAALLGLFAWYTSNQLRDSENQRALEERWEWDCQVIGLALKAGFWEQQPLTAVDPAGCLPYWSELPSLDMMGLNDYHIARNRPADAGAGKLGHELGDGEYVLSRQPDLILFCGPQGSLEHCYTSGEQMLEKPEFYQLYTPVRFEGRHPYLFRSILWVQRESPKIGIRRGADEVILPAYLLNADPDTVTYLDENNHFVVALDRQKPLGVRGLDLPPGRWQITAKAAVPLQASISAKASGAALLQSAPLPAVVQIDAQSLLVDLELSTTSNNPVELEKVIFTRLGE